MARQRTTDRRGHQCVGWKIVADVAKSLFVSQRFQELNDGSSARSLQVVLSCSVYTVSAVTPTGTSVVVEGQQEVGDLVADSVVLVASPVVPHVEVVSFRVVVQARLGEKPQLRGHHIVRRCVPVAVTKPTDRLR